MPNTARLALPYPTLAHTADVPDVIDDLANALDLIVTGYSQNTFALRPAAGTSGRFFFATDTLVLYYDDGTAWRAVNSIADGSITLAKLASSVPVIPVGGVIDWPWSSASIPAWSALPYGQAIAEAGRAELDALDGAGTHGVSAGNIVLPDYRGRVGVGKDDMGGSAASRITAVVSGINGATLGATGGAQGVSLATGELPAHNHTVSGAPGISDPTHRHPIPAQGTGSGPSAGLWSDGSGKFTDYAATGITATVGTLTTLDKGSGTPHQNVQPTIIVNKIMRVA